MEKMNNKRKKILVVTHQYLPHVSPRTTRWKLIVDDLINKGHEVTVVTGTQQLDEEKNIQNYCQNIRLARLFDVLVVIYI